MARKNSRGKAPGDVTFVSAAAASRDLALEVTRVPRRVILRLAQRPPHAKHDRPAQQREAGEQHQDPLRHGVAFITSSIGPEGTDPREACNNRGARRVGTIGGKEFRVL
jgi:hypothetical protein